MKPFANDFNLSPLVSALTAVLALNLAGVAAAEVVYSVEETNPVVINASTSANALVLAGYASNNRGTGFYTYDDTVSIRHERQTTYSSSGGTAVALQLNSHNLYGNSHGLFKGDVSIYQSYTKATGSLVSSAALHMGSGTLAQFEKGLKIEMHSATEFDPADPRSSIAIAQGIRAINTGKNLFSPSTSLSVDGSTEIIVDNGKYASVGITSVESINSSLSNGTFSKGITYHFGSEGLMGSALSIRALRGRNAIGILFGTTDKESSMTVTGDTMITAGGAARMNNDEGSAVYPDSNFTFSKIVNANGDIANIGLWNEKGSNTFNGHLDITLLADGKADAQNFGIVSNGGTVTVSDGLTVNAYEGADASSQRMLYDAENLRAIQLLNGGSLTVSSKTQASVIRSNIFIRGSNNKLNLDFDREDALLEGNLIADNINADSFNTDRDNTTNLSFRNGGRWMLSRSNSLTTLNLGEGGIVEFCPFEAVPDSFRTLRVGAFTGSNNADAGTGALGKIVLSIDTSAPNRSDKIEADTHVGRNVVDFNLIGGDSAAQDAIGTVFADVGEESGEFVGAETEGTLFWNTYDVASREEEGRTLWYLDAIEQSGGSTTTTTAIDAAAASNYVLWRQENELVRDRLGELRDHSTPQKTEGLWARVGYGETGLSGTGGFDADFSRFQIGFDHRLNTKAFAAAGLAFDYRTGTVDITRGSADNDAYGFSAYFTTYGDSGLYADAVLRYTRLSSDMTAHDTNGKRIGFKQESDALAASLEVGRRIFFGAAYVEPHAKITAGRIFSSDANLSNGAHVEYDGMSSIVGRLGITTGARITPAWQAAVKASVLKEFTGRYRAEATYGDETRRLSRDYDDAWVVLGVDSTYALNDSVYFYGTAQYETGGDLKDSWNVTGGLRWLF